ALVLLRPRARRSIPVLFRQSPLDRKPPEEGAEGGSSPADPRDPDPRLTYRWCAARLYCGYLTDDRRREMVSGRPGQSRRLAQPHLLRGFLGGGSVGTYTRRLTKRRGIAV